MAHLTPEAHRLLARQHGIASIAGLIASGVPLHDIRRIQRAGGLEQVLQGAYRSPSVPLTESARCAAVCIAHPDLVIAGLTAARLWNFRRIPTADRRVHVIAPPRSHPTIATWVVPYRTAAIHSDDVIERDDGIRLTSRARTAFDLARSVDVLTLRSIIEQALAEGPHDEADLFAVAVDWLSPRRPWARTFLQQVVGRVGGGGAESHHELLLAEALVRAGITGLRRQHEVVLPRHGRVRFDLAKPDLAWAIEVDVHPSHRDAIGVERDARRDRAACAAGWLVSRVPDTGFGDRLAATVSELVSIHDDRLRTMRAGGLR